MSLKDYDAYLFDWDGTLARTVEVWLEEIQRQFSAHGLEISSADNARHLGNLKSPLLYGLPEHKLTEFHAGIDRAAQARLPNTPLYEDVDAMLRGLKKQGKKLALVTTSLRRSLDIVIKNHDDVEELFDVVLTSEDVRAHKPDPEGINLVLAKLGVAKTKALMLGDSDKDLLAAKNAGVDSLLFYPDSHTLFYQLAELQKHGPTFVINKWQELLDQLQLEDD